MNQKQWGKVVPAQRQNKKNQGRRQETGEDMELKLDRELDHGTVVKEELDKVGQSDLTQLFGLTVVVVVVWVDWA